MVSTADPQMTQNQTSLMGPSAVIKIRRKAAKAAALGPVERKAVMGVGAPS